MSERCGMTDYLALVGRGTAGYKDVFAPGSPLLGENGDTFLMLSFTGSTPRLQWRIWIPPGTRSLQSSIFTYASPPEAKVLLRMHQPPVGNVDSVTAENANAIDSAEVLSLLLQGAEVPCFAPASSGAVVLSMGRMDSPVLTTTGGWLYVNALQLPGALVFKIESLISVDRAQYLDWYDTATWDTDGNPVAGAVKSAVDEQYVLRRVQECELIEPLRKLAGGVDDAALVTAAKETGLWAALLKFTK